MCRAQLRVCSTSFRSLALMLLLFGLSALGCGGGLSPVAGKLTWKDGSPAKELSGSQVVFEESQKHTSSIGMIGPDGTFTMTTNKPGDGVPTGHHKVAILEHRPNSNTAGTQLVPAKLHLKYADLNSSGLEVDIKPGKNEVSFTLERAAAQ